MRSLKIFGPGYKLAHCNLIRLSQETDVSVGSASKATKLIKFRPHRGANALKPIDAPKRTWFCNRMLKYVQDWLLDPQLLFITGEAYIHLSGHVNSQNTRIWSDENLHAVHQIPLHDIKIGV
jgi:hypothetical protein